MKMTVGGFIRPCIVRWGVLVPGPVEFYMVSSPKRTCGIRLIYTLANSRTEELRFFFRDFSFRAEFTAGTFGFSAEAPISGFGLRCCVG